MLDKELSAVTKADIYALIESGRKEDRTIEYKRDLPGGSDEERRSGSPVNRTEDLWGFSARSGHLPIECFRLRSLSSVPFR
jgi:hypothetical protein